MENKLQDTILNECRKNKTGVTVITVNGFQMEGTIEAFDNFIIVFRSRGKQQIVYKHAISTIVPSTPLKINDK